MKSAALIFGLLAGLLGGAVIAFGNLEPGLSVALALGERSDLVAKFVLFAIPGICLLGAGLAISLPRLGAAFMLLSAAAWAVVAFLAGHGAVLFAALPFTFAGAGGLVALFAPGRIDPTEDGAGQPLPLPPPRRRAPRDWREDSEDVEPQEPGYTPPPRPLRERSEPSLGIMPAPRGARATTPVAPRYRDEPELADEQPPEYEEEHHDDEPEEAEAEEPDYIDADPAIDVEPEPARPRYQGAEPDDDAEPEEEPRLAPQPKGRPRQDRWSLPDPEQQPARRRPLPPRYVAERQPMPPTRREAMTTREDARSSRRSPDEDDFDLSQDDYPRPRRGQQQRPREQYRDYEDYDEPQRAPNPLRLVLRLLVLALFAALVIGIAVWVYLDYQRGSQSLLFGNRVHHISAPKSDAPPVPAANTESSVSDSGTDLPDAAPAESSADASSAAPAPAAPSAAPAATPTNPAPVPLALTAPPAQNTPATAELSDPFAYCRSVDTIDAPDNRYTGPAVPDVIASSLSLTGRVPSDQVHWRCAGKQVLACNANHTAACNLTPTVDLMLSYCAQHPNTKNIPAPNGSWSCNGTRPSIPSDQQWPVDTRGFFPQAWMRVPPAQTGAG